MSLTKAEMDRLIASDPKFKALVDIHGTPTAIAPCVPGQPGGICMAGNCVNGQQLVLRCDPTGGCTVYDTIPC